MCRVRYAAWMLWTKRQQLKCHYIQFCSRTQTALGDTDCNYEVLFDNKNLRSHTSTQVSATCLVKNMHTGKPQTGTQKIQGIMIRVYMYVGAAVSNIFKASSKISTASGNLYTVWKPLTHRFQKFMIGFKVLALCHAMVVGIAST